MARKQDKQKARGIAQAQKLKQQEKLTAPPVPIAPPVPAAVPVQDDVLLLTVPQVCSLLSVSRRTLYRVDIPGKIKLGNQVRYHRPTIEAWLCQQLTKETVVF
jgi:excisionase family DNA binding protein